MKPIPSIFLFNIFTNMICRYTIILNSVNEVKNIMKLALPDEKGYVNQHFGKSTNFCIVEVQNKEILNLETITVIGLQHQHLGLAQFLKSHGVDTVIVGGIGSGAIQPLKDMGFNVICGASGQIKQVVALFINGQLEDKPVLCNCHH